MKGFVLFACVCAAWGAPALNKGKFRFYLFQKSLLKHHLFSEADSVFDDRKLTIILRKFYEKKRYFLTYLANKNDVPKLNK